MEPRSGIKPWQWTLSILVVLLLIGLAIYFSFFSKNAENGSTVNYPSQTTPVKYRNHVSVADQFPGNIVYISNIELTKPGFASVVKSEAGKPGPISLGATYFESGTHIGQVNLTEKTKDGQTYFLVLFTDTNNDKKLDANDTPALDDAGNQIAVPFKVTTQIPDKG